MQIQVILAYPDHQEKIELSVEEGSKLSDLLANASLKARIDEFAPQIELGILGQIVDHSYVLQENDRLEVYRPLIINPKEARARRAKIKTKLLEQEKMRVQRERNIAYRLARQAYKANL